MHCGIAAHFEASYDSMQRAMGDELFVNACRSISRACVRALRDGGKLMFAGNGGSAADAQHIAGEFVSRLNFDRAPLAAIALSVDTSVLTAIGNDYGYECVFERQVLALANHRDIFFGISTSGRSLNILRALQAAREKGAISVGFTGASGGDMASLCDILLTAPHDATPMIQQLHITAAHAICGEVEAEMFSRAK